MKPLRVLVTGGAGYIGSHVVRCLRGRGHHVTVFDSLVTGHAWAVEDAELVVGDLANPEQVEAVLSGAPFDACMNFAASIWVGESVRDPAKYYFNNTTNALRLFGLCVRHGVERIVFSSTAAVYGEPDADLIGEDLPLRPINPYGASKMMAERMLADIAAASALRYVALRYFNVAGAADDGSIGEATPDNSHLVKVACEVAMGLRPGLFINGVDYQTPDGTCIRDYVHVEDLAEAHVAALDYLVDGGESVAMNCGYGHGYSVRQVLDTVQKVVGRDLPITEGPRRAGDPPHLVASNAKIQAVLGWQPRRDDLEAIVGSAWRWEQTLDARRKQAGAASA
ncbi:UDP-glucose 4-epimerase GalE [Marinivivus vitaminiproducens]|uniref:UDP-glucose 4-epimerase GalE n=1 Tax=Marinivivus vitaminiproducens TaxID=3035935 RepID=UPI002798C2D2|nr:UDP-glucose 4-epimerase GalE [Geminicoccaceae bacterium SCSIO 64248]